MLTDELDARQPFAPLDDPSRLTSALEVAIFAGRVEMVDLVLNHGAGTYQVAPGELAPLTAAAMLGHTDIVRLLLLRGADVNFVDPGGSGTALLAAVEDDYPEIVALLLKAGADPNVRIEGQTALGLAYEQGHEGIADQLVAAGGFE